MGMQPQGKRCLNEYLIQIRNEDERKKKNEIAKRKIPKNEEKKNRPYKMKKNERKKNKNNSLN